jgi:hypothetical protein
MKVRIEGTEEEMASKALAAAKSVLRALVEHDPRLEKALDALEEPEDVEKAQTKKPRLRFHVRDERTLSKNVADWTVGGHFGNRSVDTGSSGPNYKYKVPIPAAVAQVDVGKTREAMEQLVDNLLDDNRRMRNREDYYFRDGKSFPVYGAREYHLAAHAFWEDDVVDEALRELATIRAEERKESVAIDPFIAQEENDV